MKWLLKKLGIGLTQYERDLREYKKGKGFPYWNYPRHEWPAPFYKLVSREQTLGHCPNCGSKQYTGPQDRFPKEYCCYGCGFNGPHPLAAQA